MLGLGNNDAFVVMAVVPSKLGGPAEVPMPTVVSSSVVALRNPVASSPSGAARPSYTMTSQQAMVGGAPGLVLLAGGSETNGTQLVQLQIVP